MNDEALFLIVYDSHKIIPEACYTAFVDDPNCPNDAPPEREAIYRGWVSF